MSRHKPLLFAILFLLFPFSLSQNPILETPAPSARTPLLMLSTMDGTVSAFDAHTGNLLFSHRDARPAVDSWAAPGMHEYVPSLDGRLYRIDRTTEEAHLVDDKFINLRVAKQREQAQEQGQDGVDVLAPGEGVERGLGADAVILTDEKSSVMYIDLRTGRVVRELSFGEAPKNGALLPGVSEHVIVVSRTSVGVEVLDAESGIVVANASLVHTVPSFLDKGTCLKGGDQGEDAFVAYMTPGRDRVTVKSMITGKVLWSKEVSTPVVEAHGMGGVRITAAAGGTDMIGEEDRDVIVGREGGYVYAMLGGANGEQGEGKEEVKMLGDGKGKEKYRLKVDRGDFLPLVPSRNSGSGERVPSRREFGRGNEDMGDLVFMVGSRDAGLAFLVLIVVGFVGYVVGRNPRRREKRRMKKKKERKKGQGVVGERRGDMDMEGGEGNDSETDIEEEEATAGRKKDIRHGTMDSDRDARGMGTLGRTDGQIESSTESSGSGGGGGFISNRTQSGWMSVGCLQVSSKVLGVGSHGTVVYEGKMMPGERKVAVKRLLRQFFESARKEISLLVELDEASPHVVRYFAMEEDSEFIYLALELCAASLAERVTHRLPPVPPSTYCGGPPPNYATHALKQLLQGLADLHRVGVVHRDVKPQNVLLTRSSSTGKGDIKLADVGLALRLAANRSSYTAVTNAGGGVGTTGWRAPEVLSGGRQTKAVDIFAAGCVVSFVLTGGDHPFGNAIFGRDGNIAAGKPNLDSLEELELPEATDIVKKMIDPVAMKRPSAEEALKHPFFWTDAMKLAFLVDISDRLYDTRHDPARYTENLDRYPQSRKFCSDWLVRMHMDLLMELGRGYDNTASGLLRVIRNKKNHYSELPSSLRHLLGELPEDKHRSPKHAGGPNTSGDSEEPAPSGNNFLTYFTRKVPQLLMVVYQYAMENPLLIDQPHFMRYGLQPLACNQQVPLHPFVRRMRANRLEAAATPSRPIEMDQQVNGLVRDLGLQLRGPGMDEDLPYVSQDSLIDVDEEEVGTTRPTRRSYHRHELVAIQALCRHMPPEVQRRAIALSLYQPSAFARNRKRLETNLFEESDFDDLHAEQEDITVNKDVPPGFQRVLPKRHSQYGATAFSSKGQAHMAGSPGSSRIPGFSGGLPPGFPTTAGRPPGFTGIGQHGTGSTAPTSSYPRRNSTPNITPTVSQFSGEERVVDFGALRRRNGPPPQ